MSHQPFEDWILDPGQRSADERRALQAHLAACPQCQRLENRWLAVRQQLRARPMASPAPGFTQRWQAGLAERRAREQRRQAWKIFGLLIGGAFLILLLLAIYTAVTTTPAEWLGAFVQTYTSSQSIIELARYGLETWLTGAPLALHVALWVYLALTALGLTMIWGLIVWRTKTVGAMES